MTLNHTKGNRTDAPRIERRPAIDNDIEVLSPEQVFKEARARGFKPVRTTPNAKTSTSKPLPVKAIPAKPTGSRKVSTPTEKQVVLARVAALRLEMAKLQRELGALTATEYGGTKARS